MAHEPVMSAAAIEDFLDREFPQMHHGGRLYSIEAVKPLGVTLRCAFKPEQLRPGGTISGPTIMTLADVALYMAVLASIGPVALAVTTSFSFNFLRKPAAKDLIAECRLLKLGQRLAVGEVSIRSDGSEEIVAHATGTYAIPAGRGAGAASVPFA